MVDIEKNIERMEELSRFLFRKYTDYFDSYCAVNDALELLKEHRNLHVVLCENCLNYRPDRTNECFLHNMHTESDRYCAWGVTRE